MATSGTGKARAATKVSRMAGGPKTAKRTRARYQPHPGLGMEARALATLAEETGRTWQQWIAVAKKSRIGTQAELKAWLVDQHGLKPMRAAFVAWHALSDEPVDYENPEALVDALYSGPRAALRPLHEKIVDQALALGDDVVATSCKTMVPLFRKHVFAQLRPVAGAVEVAFALGQAPASKRLERVTTGSPGDRLTHRTRVRSAQEVDAELKGLLKEAYERGNAPLPRATTAEVPPDFAKALKASAPARATWESCTPAMRRDVIEWIVSAKQAETRRRRIELAVGRLADGKRRMY